MFSHSRLQEKMHRPELQEAMQGLIEASQGRSDSASRLWTRYGHRGIMVGPWQTEGPNITETGREFMMMSNYNLTPQQHCLMSTKQTV